MLPLIFKRKKTAEFLRQNSGDMEERKKYGGPHHPHRPRTLEDSVYSGGGSQSCSFEGAQGSNPGGGGNPPRHGGGVGVDGGVGGGGGGGSGEGYYLSTGSGYSYYDCSRAVPQARRSPSPVGSGEWALRECEVGLFVCPSIRLFVRCPVRPCVCLSVRPSICPHACPLVGLSACLPLRLSVRQLSVCVPIYLRACLSACPSVSLSICLPAFLCLPDCMCI